jgi:ATP-dependent DNA helicase RecQ
MVAMPAGDETHLRDRIHATLKHYWGYESLRPLQEEAIRAGLERRHSLTVLPTGGGKSLCYQVPPLLADRTDIVVSPLIALMKDQVDGLRACGYPAAALHSGMPREAVGEVNDELRAGRLRLLFVAPERLLMPGFIRWLASSNIRSFAIDEAHCISHWGHDFRPEYRRLVELKQQCPDAVFHAFTATATERVRKDIVQQLQLDDPVELVGSFDRPNLVYRVLPRTDVHQQIADILARHKRQAAIVYCISRKDTEAAAEALRSVGVRAAFYHAGMDPRARRHTQDAFAKDEIDVIVATVAFGMGIDRSDVRCVIHAAMPKSLEHYQQESGRAGRDGLEAECVLLYSAADAMRWESMIGRSAAEAEVEAHVIEAATELLGHIRRYAAGVDCRHASLVRYFGQAYEKPECGACDVCLDEIEGVEDVTVLAQKIISCVARVEQRFGVGHVVDVLRGAKTERMRQFRHEQLSTFGLLADTDKDVIKRRVYELLDQGLLARSDGEYPVLQLNRKSWEVLRGEREVRLRKLETRTVRATRAEAVSWAGVDKGLYAALRELRLEMSADRNVPGFQIFNDVTMRDIARRRPVTTEAFLAVHGIGQRKSKDFGDRLTAFVAAYCKRHSLPVDQEPPAAAKAVAPRVSQPVSASLRKAFGLFADGTSIEETMELMQRARSTTIGYLAEYIAREGPERLDRWVDAATVEMIAQAAARVGTRRHRPIYDDLDGAASFDTIRLVVAHLERQAEHGSERQPRAEAGSS